MISAARKLQHGDANRLLLEHLHCDIVLPLSVLTSDIPVIEITTKGLCSKRRAIRESVCRGHIECPAGSIRRLIVEFAERAMEWGGIPISLMLCRICAIIHKGKSFISVGPATLYSGSSTPLE
jgi:hypothetical protein